MTVDAARLFIPLIQDMRATKTKYGEIQEKLVDAILSEMAKKVVLEITDAAKFAINILKRNLFERTADVGYLATDAETDGYQGFYGLTWYAVAMIDIAVAFKTQPSDDALDKSILRKLQAFSGELSSIKQSSEELLDDMKLDSINGRVKANKFQAMAFVEVLHYVKWIGVLPFDLTSSPVFLNFF